MEAAEVRDKMTGKFHKGQRGGPGRKRGHDDSVRRQYLSVITETVTLDKWQRVIEKATEQALNGDAKARSFIANYLIGKPIQAVEVSGPGGGPMNVIKIVAAIMTAIGDTPELQAKVGQAVAALEIDDLTTEVPKGSDGG